MPLGRQDREENYSDIGDSAADQRARKKKRKRQARGHGRETGTLAEEMDGC